MINIKQILKIEQSYKKRQVQSKGQFFHDYYIPKVIKYCLYLAVSILSTFHYFILILGKKRKRINNPKYIFSICSIFKDEELALKEWIEYHLIIGVEHFYLYNNNSTDNYSSILTPYIEKGIVTLTDWPFTKEQQMPAYNDCFQKFKDDTQWLAFIDLDEFICPFYETDIKQWISKYKKYPSVYVYWKMFGTSGIVEHDKKKLIVEQYINSWDRYYDIGKSIFNTSFDVYKFDKKYLHTVFGSINFCGKKFRIPPVNEFKKFVLWEVHRLPFEAKFSIQLNHYISKSYTEFTTKKRIRGDATFVGEQAKLLKSNEVFLYFQHQCISSDYKIYRFINELKIKMGYMSSNEKNENENENK